MTTVPLGKAARATRAVSAGIVPIGSGRRLMADPSISREGEDHAPGCITVQFADSISPMSPSRHPDAQRQERSKRSMSLFGPLYTGDAGLAAQGKAMSMISDDIANVNTTGYKGTTADFSTLVTENNDAELYNPGSVQALAGQTITIQGVIQGTSSPTDAAIDGAGFFVVNSKPDGTGAQLYTRDGSFTPDSLGNLRTASGFYLQGWALDANQQIANVNAPTTVNVSGVTSVPTATTTVKAGINLDADQTVYSGI